MNLILPVQGKMTSGFGWRNLGGEQEFHNGIDLAVPIGTEVKAAAGGKVLKTYYNDLGGNQLVIEHPNGYQTGYAHLSAFLVKPGDQVKKGDSIARSGNTGKSTGAHLHFTVRNKSGETIDPLKALRSGTWLLIFSALLILLIIVMVIYIKRKFKK